MADFDNPAFDPDNVELVDDVDMPLIKPDGDTIVASATDVGDRSSAQ